MTYAFKHRETVINTVDNFGYFFVLSHSAWQTFAITRTSSTVIIERPEKIFYFDIISQIIYKLTNGHKIDGRLFRPTVE